jgi:predicted RNase H-like HicB family nuclease
MNNSVPPYGQHIVVAYSPEDQAWLARAPLLFGCVADGPTPQAAVEELVPLIEGWMESAKERGWEIPAPLHDEVALSLVPTASPEFQAAFGKVVQEEAQRLIQSAMKKAQQAARSSNPARDIGQVILQASRRPALRPR